MPPHRLPAFQISHFLTTNTIPISLSSLPSTSPSDARCPICRTTYANPPTDYVHPLLPSPLPEYAVQIIDRGTCEHIFGRHCIELHIRGGDPWSHTCRVCRVGWFPAPAGGRREVLDQVEGARRAIERLLGEMVDESVRVEVEGVARALERIEVVLGGRRWIDTSEVGE